jgi:homocysteine S-methyltransferase
MVNCAHPTHVAPALALAKAEGAGWLERLKGIRANSSRKSHPELDERPDLDRGDPHELAHEVAQMQRDFDLCVVGGCCGTDAEHVTAIAAATSRA